MKLIVGGVRGVVEGEDWLLWVIFWWFLVCLGVGVIDVKCEGKLFLLWGEVASLSEIVSCVEEE